MLQGSWIQGWVSATEAGLKAAAVAVAVLGLAKYIGGAGPRAGSVLPKLG